ncbi:GNAT family N-acetyltransferase [Dasania marina]|uniref:GNAT family N-acetyltransferase n=1 Tax=Dasania marina TaxID=471499 RepID=UPI00037FABB9|nr:GNAT family N-acetyltransferase [Dasania marina]
MSKPLDIIRVTQAHTAELGRLFDLYRQFYDCDADLELAKQYISDRINNDESVIFAATEDGETLLGFVQLYPSFCSVEVMKIFILYDLYVDADGRNKGIGALLMNKASEFAKASGAGRVDLLTGHSNKPGQHLYEKLGYEKVNEEFYGYSLYV